MIDLRLKTEINVFRSQQVTYIHADVGKSVCLSSKHFEKFKTFQNSECFEFQNLFENFKTGVGDEHSLCLGTGAEHT